MPRETETNRPQPMDRFTRNYSIGLGLFLLALLVWWLSHLNPRIGEINGILQADPLLSAYPYQFRVASLENGVAELTTPRSFEVPVMKFLVTIQPGLRGKPQDHPDMAAAQADLVKRQKHAHALVLEQADIKSVRWVLDRGWYAERGILID